MISFTVDEVLCNRLGFVVSSKSFLPHVIHVCTCAFVFVVLQSLSTFDGHFLFFDNFIKPTSQIALPAIEPYAPIPRNEDHGSLSKTTPLTGSEPNVTDNSDDFQVAASVFQRSSVKTVHDLGDDDAETPDAGLTTSTSGTRSLYHCTHTREKQMRF